jgi:hypothetical protein
MMKKIAQLVKEYDIEKKLIQVGFKPPFIFKEKTAQIIPADGFADGGEAYSDEEMDLIQKDDLAHDIYTRLRAEKSLDGLDLTPSQKIGLERIRDDVRFNRNGDEIYFLGLIKSIVRGDTHLE